MQIQKKYNYCLQKEKRCRLGKTLSRLSQIESLGNDILDMMLILYGTNSHDQYF